MIDDKLGAELLTLMDRIRKRYGKSMQEKDKTELMELNKQLYAKVGGIIKDPMVRQNPRGQSVSPGGFQVSPARQAEAVDLQRLAKMTIESILKKQTKK